MGTEPKIAAVVVTHDRAEMLKRCLAALKSQTTPCGILLVDNASQDGTREVAKAFAEGGTDLHCHTMEENTGGAGGFSYGIRWAVETGFDYVWVMDDDCIPASDALEKLLEADRLLGGPERYGFLASAVLWTDGRPCQMNIPKGTRHCWRQVELLDWGLLPVVQATFVSLLLPARTVQAVGLPIAAYFLWGDDIEYTRRIAVRHGMPCYLAGQSRVVHATENNLGSDIATDSPERMWRYRLAFRNEAHLFRQEGFRGVIYHGALCGLHFLRILKTRGNGHKGKRIAAMIGGLAAGMFFHPQIEQVSEWDSSGKTE